MNSISIRNNDEYRYHTGKKNVFNKLVKHNK